MRQNKSLKLIKTRKRKKTNQIVLMKSKVMMKNSQHQKVNLLKLKKRALNPNLPKLALRKMKKRRPPHPRRPPLKLQKIVMI